MVAIIQGPSWFVHFSVGIELLGAFMLGLIAISVIQYFFLTGSRKWLRVGTSFALLASAALGQAVLSYGLFIKPYGVASGGVAGLVIHFGLLRSMLFFFAVFVLEFLSIYGLFLLFSSYHETSKTMHALVAFLLMMLLYFGSEAYFVYHLLALVLFSLIATSLLARLRLGRGGSWFLILGFILLAVSRFLFILVPFNVAFSIAGSFLQIIGLSCILIVFLLAVRHAKKITT